MMTITKEQLATAIAREIAACQTEILFGIMSATENQAQCDAVQAAIQAALDEEAKS